MPFCRHITPLYSGAGYRPSHASYLCRFAGMLHRCTLAPVHRPSKASYLCSFAGILHRCYLVPVNRPSHASRESGVAYLIGEVNCRCFSCMQRVMVGVCFPTLFSPSVASWFRRMVLGFSSCAYMWFSHMRKYDALCASGSFLRYVAACFVITCSMTMASSIMFEHLLRFSSGYNRPLSNIFGHLIWCHILCVFDLIYFSIIFLSIYFETRNFNKQAIQLQLVSHLVRMKYYQGLCFDEE